MPGSPNAFSQALARHQEGGRLREAFEWCRRQPGIEPYDRTSLGRWLGGAVPSREPFVKALSGRLNDPTIHSAWTALQDDRGDGEVKGIVTRFQGLSPDDKVAAFAGIAAAMAQSTRVVRSGFSMRVDLYDGHDDDLLRLRVEVGWTGHLPANAEIMFMNEQDGLAEAYAEERCLFRDVVHLEDERLHRVMADEDEYQHSLSYSPVGTGKTTSCSAERTAAGQFRFGNEELARARIKLRTTYPFPRGLRLYPIIFNAYRIAGPFTLSLILHSQKTQWPQCFSFLGQDPRWEASQWRRELAIESGYEGAVLGTGTGLVFYWSEST